MSTNQSHTAKNSSLVLTMDQLTGLVYKVSSDDGSLLPAQDSLNSDSFNTVSFSAGNNQTVTGVVKTYSSLLTKITPVTSRSEKQLDNSIQNLSLSKVYNSSTLSTTDFPNPISLKENSTPISLSRGLESIISQEKPHTLMCQCGSCFIPYVEPKKYRQSKAATLTGDAPTSLSNTFKLHSNPNANHTIHLDFNGHSMNSSEWENGGSLRLGGYDTDGNVNSFSDSELEEIQLMWQRAAEDFAPFNINVTTEEPTNLGDLINSGSGDTRWGIRVAITDNLNLDTGSAITNAGGGGTAFLGSFNWNYDEVALVFNPGAYAGGETISHEVGHTLGLDHDGQLPGTEYYGGHGTGETSWSPIMGAGIIGSVDDNVTQWTKSSEYFNGNRAEDDLTIITTTNGFGYRTDDHGNTNATATVLASNNLNSFGIIERNTDLDVFSFNNINSGNVTFTITPASRAFISNGLGTFATENLEYYGPNLDIWAGIYNSQGSLIAESNPSNIISANFTNLFLNAGQYYLKIDGVGTGTPLSSNPTGYTDYGSLGQYSITGIFNSNNSANLAIAATNANQAEGNSGAKAFTFTLTRSGTTTVANDVNWAVTGSGTNPANATDFAGGVLPSGIVSWAAGDNTPKVITVNVQGDATVELNENFTVTLSNPTNGATITTATALGTIQNDDGNTGNTFSNNSPITIQDATASNPYPSTINVSGLSGNLATLKVTLTNLSHSWPDDIDVLLVGPNGAKAILMSDVGGSNVLSNVTLTFDPLATAALPDSGLITSGTYLPTDFVTGDLFNSPAPVGPYGTDFSVFNNTNPNGLWSLYIMDDEALISGSIAGGWSLNIGTASTAPTLVIAATSATQTEGNSGSKAFTFTVTRAVNTTGINAVNWAVTGSGTNPANTTDFVGGVLPSGTVSFAAGETSKLVTVNVQGDTTVEPDENFTVTLSAPTNGATITTATASGTIQNDDGVTTPSITLASNYSGVSENGKTNLVYNFNRTGDTTSSFTVNFGVSGNAINGDDYVAYGGAFPTPTQGTITFAVGATTAQLALITSGDTVKESNETIGLTLTSGLGYQIGTPTAVTTTILNDDGVLNQQGTTGSDVIEAGSTSTLSGKGGSDILIGSSASNILVGGAGNDTLTTGTGFDTVLFTTTTEGIDTITDFNVNQDIIQVSAANFGGGLIAGESISADQFSISLGAVTANTRFIFDKPTGKLYFDVDGSGSNSSVQFASLTANLGLTEDNIFVA